MDLSLVILHSNTPKDAEMCLRSLRLARLPKNTEIFIIDNSGKRSNAQIPRDAADGLSVLFLETPIDGYIYGNNLGYQLATGRIIGTMNADITVRPETIEQLIAHLNANPDVGIVAPRLYYPSGHEQDSARRFPTISELLSRRLLGRVHQRLVFGSEDFAEVDWITGAFFFMTRACLEATKGHDPLFHLFMSDIALCRNAWRLGFRVRQLRDCSALHHESRLSGGTFWHLLQKRTGRIHILDSLTYFVWYGPQSAPALSPSGHRPR